MTLRLQAALRADNESQFDTQEDRVRAIIAAVEDHDRADGILRLTAESVRELSDSAWKKGYQACYEGQQRHSPYQAPRAGSTSDT
ncbi:hypothetical protein HTS88_12205 [Pseudarthrobacter oxydans]|uniref:hypothetical protein n=1 Tax=Pseudarthrobacter oxydans TaxID=1671 RepID=UPI001572E372|nr:hypothetical protein [Pseudarthrobacter oxydans]NSX37161.1 hypothetical protein [Pseudarthrobacter oxydans]